MGGCKGDCTLDVHIPALVHVGDTNLRSANLDKLSWESLAVSETCQAQSKQSNKTCVLMLTPDDRMYFLSWGYIETKYRWWFSDGLKQAAASPCVVSSLWIIADVIKHAPEVHKDAPRGVGGDES
jgi:hypothetical protein